MAEEAKTARITQKAPSVTSVNEKSTMKLSTSADSKSTMSKMPVTNTRGTIAPTDESAYNQQKDQHNVKKFFHKLKESLGLIEKTEYPKELIEAYKELDSYKLCLDSLGDTLAMAIQRDTRVYRSGEVAVMSLEPPEGSDEYEMVRDCLKGNKPEFGGYPTYATVTDHLSQLAKEHREFEKRGRKAIRHIRGFIKHDYWVIAQHRNEMDQLRWDMDFAKNGMKSAKGPQMTENKSRHYETCARLYNDKMKLVRSKLWEMGWKKEMHAKDLLEWALNLEQFHGRCAALLNRKPEKAADKTTDLKSSDVKSADLRSDVKTAVKTGEKTGEADNKSKIEKMDKKKTDKVEKPVERKSKMEMADKNENKNSNIEKVEEKKADKADKPVERKSKMEKAEKESKMDKMQMETAETSVIPRTEEEKDEKKDK